MTRDTKTISAVFMAALLVLASGAAVSLAATDTGDAAVGATEALQETTTELTTEAVDEETTEAVDETDEEDEETTEAPDEETTAAAEVAASVTINDQESDGEQIVVESVTMDEGGFVAIHDETLLEGDALGSVVGNSVYLEPGVHENVTVTLARPIEETQTLIAMPHLDTNDNEVYDFVIAGGASDGPYVADGEAVVDQATVSVGAEEPVETETEEPVETETEEPVETETEEPVETETEEPVETETEEPVETETEEPVETETEEPVETETEEPVETETEEPVETETEEPADQQQFVFKIEQMNIDRWSFVVGDEETPDRTETVSDITVTDRRVEINLTELLQQQAAMADQQQPITTQDPDEVQEQLQENLSQDLETVRFVIEDVSVENVTFVVTAPEGMEMPAPPTEMEPETTTEEEDVIEETTTEEDELEETTPEEEETTEEVVETETTTEDVVEETTTTEEEIEETTTTEEEIEETTTTEEEIEETTTEEEDVVAETTTETVEETTEAEETDLESFTVSELDAPDSAEVGDTLTVSALVANPNDAEASQGVAFRLQGDVIESQTVTLAGQEETRVTFEVDTSELVAGEYIHGVYTEEYGELAVIALSEPTAEETTEAVETETPADGEETTATIVVETMTETTEAEA